MKGGLIVLLEFIFSSFLRLFVSHENSFSLIQDGVNYWKEKLINQKDMPVVASLA